ncbi:glutathione S-transferase N-terminal domain-containing protein [Candidatus Woesearchaeota archaeon]|nr:glutathione S-transferase N-terminal domain-containing protein [Candidatus Woesearchaeota archaeon]
MKVTVYSTNQCPWCDKVKDFLTEHNIEFEIKDVGTDENAKKEMLEKTGQMGVPVTDIDGEIVVGFNIPLLRHHLKIK